MHKKSGNELDNEPMIDENHPMSQEPRRRNPRSGIFGNSPPEQRLPEIDVNNQRLNGDGGYISDNGANIGTVSDYASSTITATEAVAQVSNWTYRLVNSSVGWVTYDNAGIQSSSEVDLTTSSNTDTNSNNNE